MGKLSITAAAALAAAFTGAASGEQGFFRPAADPALTTTRPPLAEGKARASPFARPAQAPSPASVEAAGEIRKAEEAQMDRVEVERAVARTEVVANAPAITSPLDRTAPIMSPLDGTAPIISPVRR